VERTAVSRLGTPLRLDPTELLSIAEHQVHVLVERHELPHHGAPVLNRHPHAVVDVLQHLPST
jgi:hypothetical protein